MPKLTIDNREVEVPAGATILQAAEKLGIEIPTLCYLEGQACQTSCLVCVVKLSGTDRLVPSCATVAVDGMQIESQTEEVRQTRKTALELLLSEHRGDCLAPCFFACPAHMDIPLMLRQISQGNLAEAIATVKRDIAMPAVLGRICPAPCEKACRRAAGDGAVTIRQLKRYVADVDLGAENPYRPECEAASGKSVAIVGAGPTGLSAAYYLLRKGHAVTLFDDQKEPGGRLRYQIGEEKLPRNVLNAEIDSIIALGAELRMDTPVGERPSLDDLAQQFDVTLLARGPLDPKQPNHWGLETGKRGIKAEKGTFQTNRPGIFAAGGATGGKTLPVRSVADGKDVARAMHQYLAGQPVVAAERPFSSRMGRLTADQISVFMLGASDAARREPAENCSPDEAVRQSGRCLECDCRGHGTCKLEHYAAEYGADPRRYKGKPKAIRAIVRQAGVVFEPGKCINCGLCIEITRTAGEPLGLTFVGRGFDVRVDIPFDEPLKEALGNVAAQCVAACPTAALSIADSADSSCRPRPDR